MRTRTGIIYLLHFATRYKHAGHYLGYVETNLDRRIIEHERGFGANLVRVIRGRRHRLRASANVERRPLEGAALEEYRRLGLAGLPLVVTIAFLAGTAGSFELRDAIAH